MGRVSNQATVSGFWINLSNKAAKCQDNELIELIIIELIMSKRISGKEHKKMFRNDRF